MEIVLTVSYDGSAVGICVGFLTDRSEYRPFVSSHMLVKTDLVSEVMCLKKLKTTDTSKIIVMLIFP
jgi:hypothetical protein